MALHWRTDHKLLTTSIGELNYRDVGTGDPVVFVHGVFMNGGLWDDVIFYLPPDLRTIRPDFPIGGHSRPANAAADLALSGLALLLLEVIESLDLSNITLVANDIGCAICQRAVASRDVRAFRIMRLLLTNCGSLDYLKQGAGGCGEIFPAELAALLGTAEGRRQFFKPLAEAPIPDEQLCDLLGGLLQSSDVRRDAQKALREILAGTLDESPVLPAEFSGPVSVVWGLNDHVSLAGAGEKLASSFARGRLSAVKNARLLLPIDQPETLANAILNLMNEDAPDSRPA